MERGSSSKFSGVWKRTGPCVWYERQSRPSPRRQPLQATNPDAPAIFDCNVRPRYQARAERHRRRRLHWKVPKPEKGWTAFVELTFSQRMRGAVQNFRRRFAVVRTHCVQICAKGDAAVIGSSLPPAAQASLSPYAEIESPNDKSSVPAFSLSFAAPNG